MHRQVGDLVIEDGIALRGMIIRHLVLPANLANSEIVMEFIARELSRDSCVNIMAQYRPAGRVLQDRLNPEFAVLRRPITAEEYAYALRSARENGLYRGIFLEEPQKDYLVEREDYTLD
jgi:putative pyruvate formate lyase activating enzyme